MTAYTGAAVSSAVAGAESGLTMIGVSAPACAANSSRERISLKAASFFHAHIFLLSFYSILIILETSPS